MSVQTAIRAYPEVTMASKPRQLLPIEAYVSPQWFLREQKELFPHVWSFAGMTEDLKNVGDYHCVEVGDYSIIVIRTRQGEISALHNQCRHRGTKLLSGSGNVGRSITCFYHKWSYDLSGNLTGVPEEKAAFSGLDKSCLGLHRAKAATWKNLIFVHPEPNAEPLESWLAGAPSRFSPHDPEQLVELTDLLYRVRCNWKILIENFIDGYHFRYLHVESLGSGDFSKAQYEFAGRHWLGQRPLKPGTSFSEYALPKGIPTTYGASAAVLFPNLALYDTATWWLTFHVIPVDVDNSLVHVRMRAAPEALKRAVPPPGEDLSSPHLVHARGALPGGVPGVNFNKVMLEDISACEAVQSGMRAPTCKIGPLSSHELALTFFQRQLLDFVD